MGNRPINFNDPTGHTAVLPLVYIGITLFAVTALAVIAHTYANNPEFHAAADQVGLELGNSVQALKNKSQPYISPRVLHRMDDFDKKVNETNSGKKFPMRRCIESATNLAYCILAAGVVIGTAYFAGTKGGCGEPESNSKCPPPAVPPTSTSTSTPMDIPANTPTQTPTSTPTGTPTLPPTHTPTPRPINNTPIPINVPNRNTLFTPF